MKKIFFLLSVLISFQLATAQLGPEKTIASSIGRPLAYHTADLDNDTDPDIVMVTQSPDKVFWCKNLGNGSFSSPKYVSSPNFGFRKFFYQTAGITSADLDKDGKTDIIVSSFRDDTAKIYMGVVWYKNLGNDSFSVEKVIWTDVIDDTGLDAGQVEAIDIDSDGDLDVVISAGGGLAYGVRAFENNGNGTFSDIEGLFASNHSVTFDKGDIDGDGNLDLLTENYRDYYQGIFGFRWGKGDGTGKFSSNGKSDNTRTYDIFIETAVRTMFTDIDNDNDLDVLQVVIERDGTFLIGVYKNDGSGVFTPYQALYEEKGVVTPSTEYYAEIRSMKVVDFNGDGHDDLLISPQGYGNSTIKWFKNDGGKRFINMGNIIKAGYQDVVLADFDLDGDMDVISAKDKNKVVFFENLFKSSYQLKGQIFYDNNQNGILDGVEKGMNLPKVQLNGSNIANYTSNEGKYFFATTPGTYTVKHTAPAGLWTLTSDSSKYTRTLSTANSTADNLNFGFYPKKVITELEPSLTGQFPRCHQTISYWINVKNKGTTAPNGIIHLTLDDSYRIPIGQCNSRLYQWTTPILELFEPLFLGILNGLLLG